MKCQLVVFIIFLWFYSNIPPPFIYISTSHTRVVPSEKEVVTSTWICNMIGHLANHIHQSVEVFLCTWCRRASCYSPFLTNAFLPFVVLPNRCHVLSACLLLLTFQLTAHIPIISVYPHFQLQQPLCRALLAEGKSLSIWCRFIKYMFTIFHLFVS